MSITEDILRLNEQKLKLELINKELLEALKTIIDLPNSMICLSVKNFAREAIKNSEV